MGHNKIKRMFLPEGIYAQKHEVLHGRQTIRVHVKCYKGLNNICEVLDKLKRHDKVRLSRVQTPFTMKNKFQKKGFNLFLRLEHECMVPIVQSVFAKYNEFKCRLAEKPAKYMQSNSSTGQKELFENMKRE